MLAVFLGVNTMAKEGELHCERETTGPFELFPLTNARIRVHLEARTIAERSPVPVAGPCSLVALDPLLLSNSPNRAGDFL